MERLTISVFIGNTEACLQSLQWISGLSSSWPCRFCVHFLIYMTTSLHGNAFHIYRSFEGNPSLTVRFPLQKAHNVEFLCVFFVVNHLDVINRLWRRFTFLNAHVTIHSELVFLRRVRTFQYNYSVTHERHFNDQLRNPLVKIGIDIHIRRVY